MTKKKQYKTVFISDIHLSNPKNQSDKLIKFLDSISMENLIICGDLLDFWQLNAFGKRTEKEEKTLNYINNLANNGIKITYIQGNHDCKLKCGKNIEIKNMSIIREMYYITGMGKTYFITHGDCLDFINSHISRIGQLGSIGYGLLFKIESLWNKKILEQGHISLSEKIEQRIKIHRVTKKKLFSKISKFSKNLNCDGVIIGHFHRPMHEDIDGIDYRNTGDRIQNCTALVENLDGTLEIISYPQ